jgi:hypothetical protein
MGKFFGLSAYVAFASKNKKFINYFLFSHLELHHLIYYYFSQKYIDLKMQNEQEIANALAAAADPAEGAEAPAQPIAETKKKPGRPKKKIANVPVEVHGIVDKPVNDEDLLELVYCNPTLFKKIT